MKRWSLMFVVWLSWVHHCGDVCSPRTQYDPYTGERVGEKTVCEPCVDYRVKQFKDKTEADAFVKNAPASVSDFQNEGNGPRAYRWSSGDQMYMCRDQNKFCTEAK